MFIKAVLDPARVLGRMAMLLDAPPPPSLRRSLRWDVCQHEEDVEVRGGGARRRVPFLPTAAAQVCLHASFYLYVKNGFNKLKPSAVLRSGSSG